jgi:hypothetical protein
MNKYTSFVILITLIFLLGSCTHNNVYINRLQDNVEGKVFLKKFYSNIENKNYEDVDQMVGDSLKQLAGTYGISNMVKYINSKVGNYKGYIIEDYYVRCITGSVNETSYNYKLKVMYDKGTIDEIIGFKKRNGSAITINSYHANSDLLIH